MVTIVPGHLIKINATILPQKYWANMAEQGFQCSVNRIYRTAPRRAIPLIVWTRLCINEQM